MKFAAITTTSVTIPGDERSRTNPGHGYPEHTETYTKFREFESADELKRFLKMHGDVSKVRVIEFQDLEVKTEVVVDFKRPGATRVR